MDVGVLYALDNTDDNEVELLETEDEDGEASTLDAGIDEDDEASKLDARVDNDAVLASDEVTTTGEEMETTFDELDCDDELDCEDVAADVSLSNSVSYETRYSSS